MLGLPHAREGLTLKTSKIRGGVKFDLGLPFDIFPDEIFQRATPPQHPPLGILDYNYGSDWNHQYFFKSGFFGYGF
jgi:hypothetical protein